MSDGPRAVVAAHGSLAAGLVNAVACIVGDAAAARLVPLSNRTLGGAELAEALRQAVLTSGAQVVFTDLPAGSCTIAARRVARDVPGLAVVCGVNLPLLLSFAVAAHKGTVTLPEAVEKARASMLVAAEVPSGD
jgi:mannose/fructose-specific phosphotransferase system component IIA